MMYGRGYSGGYGMGTYSNGYCNGHRFFGTGGSGMMHQGFELFIIVGVIILIAAFIFFLVHRKSKKITTSMDPIMETLKMKYVQGELTEEEYLKRKELLSKK